MGQTVDTRVVELKFDNSEFEKNVQTSLKSIDNINKSLDSMGSKKSLGGLDNAAKSLSFDDTSKSASILQKRFSVLGVAGMSAINNITNSVMNMGKNMLASMSGLNAMKAGFHEYETQLNSVQTILANTKSKGSTLDDVNSALNELNHYADKTIYNFTEMTRNIGTFTAAGVGLNKSVSSIKGIANLAAVSGSNAQQASTAMYQLSQAIASGSVKLQDWNSVVNAGMGGEVFQNALKRTARAHGIAVDKMIKKYGSFRESLSKGNWLTTKVLTDTLKQFSGDVNAKQLKAQGYTKKQIKDIMDMAKTAEDAATKVKTFSQLMDTLAEAVQSGWTETWQYIIGDFGEAKKMWTSVSDTLGSFIQKSADARNSMLKFWHDAGGRTALMNSFANVFKAVLAILTPIHDAFRDVFPPSTGKGLVSFSKGLEKLTAKLIISKKTGEKIGEVFKQGFTMIANALKFVKSLLKDLEPVYDILKKIGGFLLNKFSQGVLIAAAAIGKYLNKAVDWIKSNKTIMEAVEKIEKFIKDKCESIKKTLSEFTTSSNFVKNIKKLFETFKETELPKILNKIENVLTKFIKYLEDLGSTIKNEGIPAAIDKVTSAFAKLFDLLKNEYVPKAIDKLLDTFDKIKDKVKSIDYKKAASNLSEGLVLEAYAASKSGDDIADTTATMSDRIKAFEDMVSHAFKKVKWWFGQLKDIVVDVSKTLYEFFKGDANEFNIDRVFDLAKTGAIVAILWQLQKVINTINGSIGAANGVLGAFKGVLTNVGGVLKAVALQFKAKALIDVAAAIAILAGSLYLLSLIPQDKLIMAGVALGVVGLALVGFAKLLNRIDMKAFGMAVAALSLSLAALAVSVFGLAISMGILIASLYLLVKVFQKYAAMKPEVFQKGFERIKDTITQLVKFLFGVGLSRGKGKGAAIALAALVISLYVLQNTLKLYSKMDPKIFTKGLARISGVIKAIKGLLLGLVVSTILSSGFKLIGLSTVLLSLVKSLSKLAGVLKEYASMKVSDIKKGLLAITAILFVIGTFVNSFAILSAGTNLRKLLGLSLVLGTVIGLVKGIADALSIVAGIKPEPMKKALHTLETVLITIGIFVLTVSTFGKAKTIESLAALAGLLIALSAAIYFLGKIPYKQAAHGIIILAASLAVLAGALRLAGTGRMDIGVKEFLAMAIGASALALALNELAKQPWHGILAAAVALSAVMLAIAEATKIIDTDSTIKGMAKFAIVAASTLAIAYALSELAKLPWNGMLSAAASLGAVLLAVGGAIKLASGALYDLKDLLKFAAMAGMIVVITLSLKVLATIPMKKLLDSTASLSLILLSLTAAIGVLSLIPVTSALKALANLALFLGGFEIMMLIIGKINLQISPIIDQSKGIATLLLALSGAMLILSFMPVTSALSALANLAIFLAGFTIIVASLGAISMQFKSLSGFLDKGGMILGLLGKAIGSFIGGIAAGITAQMLTTLPALGNALGMFSKGAEPFLKSVQNIDKSSAQGARILAETVLIISAASFVNGIANLANMFTGGNTLGNFGKEISALGKAVKGYGDEVKGLDGGSIKSSAEAIKALASINIANEGGAISKFAGDNTLSMFAKGLDPLGKGISSYSDKVKGINTSAVLASSKAITALASIKITREGGVFGFLKGDSSLSNFASNLVPLATGIKNFSDGVKGIDNSAILAASKAIKSLASIKITKVTGVGEFAGNLKSLGKAVTSFVKRMSNVSSDSLSNAISQIKKLGKIGSSLDVTSLRSFSRTLKSCGENASTAFAKGISNGADKSITAANKIESSAVNALKTIKSRFKTAGSNATMGFLNGIKEKLNDGSVYAAGYSIGNTAYKAARKSLEERSPSKKLAQVGIYAVEGFINGLKDIKTIHSLKTVTTSMMGQFVDNVSSASDLSSISHDSLQQAMSNLSNLTIDDINSDPVIKPVIDLEDVESGVNYMNSLINGQGSVSMSSKVNANVISSQMSKIQNGATNDDVIRAIHGLHDVITDSTGNTYTVNGVTYDDGSNITEAVKTLINASIVEKRL